MNRKKLLFCLTLATVAMAGAFKTVVGQTTEKAAPATAEKYPTLFVQARALGDATVAKNFEKVADFTHPTIVEKAGGRDRIVELSRRGFEQMETGVGIKLVGFRVGAMEQEAKVGNEIFVLLLTTVVMEASDGRFESDGSMVGMSSDNGVNWKFVNGFNQPQFEALFPELKGRIKVKETGTPRRVN